MCPITLTIVAASVTASMTALGTGAGIAAAATAGIAAGSAAATGAGLGAAIAVGTAATAASVAGAGTAALTIGGAVAFGTAATATVGGSVAGAGVGIMGTALTASSILAEVVAIVGVAQTVHQHQQAKGDAKMARDHADSVAKHERANTRDEQMREMRKEAEKGVADKIQHAKDVGTMQNAQNRSNRQIAALIREVDREAMSNENALKTRVEAVNAEARGNYRNIALNQRNAYDANRGPSDNALYINLGTSALGSLAGA
jgi:hypothetical protein